MSVCRRIIELLPRFRPFRVSTSEYRAFFDSPVWLLLRFEAARQLDIYYMTLKDPRCGIDAVNAARGAIKATEWLLDAEELLADRVTESKQSLDEDASKEARLREILNLMGEK